MDELQIDFETTELAHGQHRGREKSKQIRGFFEHKFQEEATHTRGGYQEISVSSEVASG